MVSLHRLLPLTLAALAGAAVAPALHADVTIQQQVDFRPGIRQGAEHLDRGDYRRQAAPRFRISLRGFHVAPVWQRAKRRDPAPGQGLRWSLDLKKKEYRESPSRPPRSVSRPKRSCADHGESFRQCPAAQNTAAPGPDTSKCD